jgi:hypothetical protein
MTKTDHLIKNCRLLKEKKLTAKELIFSINKKYRCYFFAGINALKSTQNPYFYKSGGFNRYRNELFKQGLALKKIFEPTLFKC